MTPIRAALTFVDGAARPDLTVLVDGARIVEVRRAEAADPPPERGLLVPGLVDAHLHLELSWAHGRVPGGRGLPDWVVGLRRLAIPDDAAEHARRAAEFLQRAGTALVFDISNRGDTAGILDAAGLQGVVQHEVLGMDRRVQEERRAQAVAPARREGGFVVRPGPHAPYSARADVIALAAAPRPGAVASLHLAEDPAEIEFVEHGTGAWASFLDEHGLAWDDWSPPGERPVAWLDGLGVLHDRLMAVHGVELADDEVARLAARGVSLCLCPRSNLHVTGRLPDVPALLGSGLVLALGTDSLASSPDLDVLGEVAELTRRWPAHAAAFLELATAGGARALRRPAGRVAAGLSPGLVLLEDVDDVRALTDAPARRWLVRPGDLGSEVA